MPTPRKEQLVAELTELLQQAEIAIATSVTGVPVHQQIALRRRLLDEGAQLRVVKNTLLRIAARNADAEVFAELADGPTALVVGFDEPISAARGISKYIDDTPDTPMVIRKAVVSGQLVDAAYVRDLATVPPREELLSRIAGGLVGKIRELMMLLEATTREFAGLVEARAAQLEEQGEGAAPAEEAPAEDAPATEEPAAESPDEAPAAEAETEAPEAEAPAADAPSDEAPAAETATDAADDAADEAGEAASGEAESGDSGDGPVDEEKANDAG
jgi:large subunit ribosomal protein L10